MEEFKTAHFKMFSRLRNVDNNESKQQQQQQQRDLTRGDDDERARNDDDDDAERDHHDDDANVKSKPKISNGNTNLANIRPRQPVATN
jgi:hypothetical protein